MRSLIVLALVTLAGACASVRAPVDEGRQPPHWGTALLAVEVMMQPTAAPVTGVLELVVEEAVGRERRFHRPAVPHHGTGTASHLEYLVVLDLPPGVHRLRSMAARQRSSDREAVLQFLPDVSFEIEAERVRYFGRLTLTSPGHDGSSRAGAAPSRRDLALDAVGPSPGPSMSVRFAPEQDLPRFRAAYPWLPAAIDSVALDLTRTGRGADAASRNGTPEAQADTTAPANATAPSARRVGEVPFPSRAHAAAQRAWRDFASAAMPRAFALSADGSYWGWASGRPDAWLAALSQCARRGAGCRLYAIDDRVVGAD